MMSWDKQLTSKESKVSLPSAWVRLAPPSEGRLYDARGQTVEPLDRWAGRPQPGTKTAASFFLFHLCHSEFPKPSEYNLEPFLRFKKRFFKNKKKTKVGTEGSEEISSVSMQSQDKPWGQGGQMASGQWTEPEGFSTMPLGVAFHHGGCLFVGGDVHFSRWPAHRLEPQPPGRLGDFRKFYLTCNRG